IGTGEREGNEPYGVDWSKPVTRFEEAMATIRALWNSGGQLVNRDSPYFPLRNALFDLPPVRGKWPPMWIAAHGPRMLRAAGRHGARRPIGAGFSGAQDLLPVNMDEHTGLSHVAQVPPALLRETTLTGTPDEVLERAAQWRDCGVRYMVLANAGPLQRRLRKG